MLALAVPRPAAVLPGRDMTASLFLIWLWLTIGAGGAGPTRPVAVREDPGIGLTDTIIVVAAVARPGSLAFVLVKTSRSHGGTNEKDPRNYVDVAPMACTIGMTFPVSDTDSSSQPMRRTALPHALISSLSGAVIVALTINVVVSLLH